MMCRKVHTLSVLVDEPLVGMQTKYNGIIVLGCISTCVFLGFVFRPYARPDPKLVDPALAALQEPIKAIRTVYYLDGGSYGIRIIDRTGSQLDLCVPAPLGDKDDQYRRVFVGAMHYTDKGAKEVANPHNTKLRLEELMRSSPGSDRRRDVALAYLSGRWSDFWRVIRRSFIFKTYHEEDA